jgi:hypothetical protein
LARTSNDVAGVAWASRIQVALLSSTTERRTACMTSDLRSMAHILHNNAPQLRRLIRNPEHVIPTATWAFRPPIRMKVSPPVIPSEARNLLLIFFSEKQIPRFARNERPAGPSCPLVRDDMVGAFFIRLLN